MGWIELFGLEEEEPIFQKRILSVVSGAVLPLVALGFIKSLTDYIRPEEYTDAKNENLDNLLTDIEDIKSKPSVNVTEEDKSNLGKISDVVGESLNIENNEDDALLKVGESIVKETKILNTEPHNIKNNDKLTLEPPMVNPSLPPKIIKRKKHYNPKP